MIYRRRINTYQWHFCQNCQAWPTDEYEERKERAATDPLDLCSECQTKLLRGECDALKRSMP